ncbi:MAG: hypothetical protein IJ532_00245 [Alphaproteobacteria bacterium]|nr:hypothetical protein [Alphaproteobacteria bacterium]
MSKREYLVDKQTMKEIGYELWKMRVERNMFLHQVTMRTGIPARDIEGMEMGRYVRYRYLRGLIAFYGKEMKIVFE